MCRNNSYTAKREEHLINYELAAIDTDPFTEGRAQYVAGYHNAPVIVRDSVTAANETLIIRWGLIPWYAKSKADGLKQSLNLVNARRDRVNEAAPYKNLIYKTRCLIPSTGYFEHHHFMRDGKDANVPMVVKTHQSIFSIAGIFGTWTDKETGEVITSFSMMTTDANALMKRVHNGGPNPFRMPLVIPKEMEADWINPGSSKSVVDEILNYSISPDDLVTWPVNPISGKKRPADENLFDKIHVPEIDWA